MLGREQVLGGGEHRCRLAGLVLDDGEADLPPERDEALADDDRVELERLGERGGQLGGALDLGVEMVVVVEAAAAAAAVVVVVELNTLLLPLLLCYYYCYYYCCYYYCYYYCYSTLEMPIELSSQHGLSTKGYGTVGTCMRMRICMCACMRICMCMCECGSRCMGGASAVHAWRHRAWRLGHLRGRA